METLLELFIDEIRDIYNAEQQLIRFLPHLEKKATSHLFKDAITSHLVETVDHIHQLETIAREMGVPLEGKRCKAMEGLILETRDLFRQEGDMAVVDAGLIGAAQRMAHYEISAYGTVRAMAEQLGKTRAVLLLQESLNEEYAWDKRLTEAAESGVLASAHASAGMGHDHDGLYNK